MELQLHPGFAHDLDVDERPQARQGAGVGKRNAAHDAYAHVGASPAGTAPLDFAAALDDVTRARLERTAGVDLGGVRIHTGEAAATSAASLGALAYTVGQDIHFASGQYDPTSDAGRHLIAHEVAHTIQQRGAAPSVQAKLSVSEPGDGAEREADRFADAFLRGTTAAVSASSVSGVVSRKDRSRPDFAKGFAKDGPAGVHIRFKGVSIRDLPGPMKAPLRPEDLPPLKQLVAMAARLRAMQPALAVAALRSLRALPDHPFVRGGSDEKEDWVELPASYVGHPPTLAVARFIAVDAAIAYLEICINMRGHLQDEAQLRQREVGGMPINGTRAQIDHYRMQRLAQNMLQGLTGTFGGLVGALAANALTDDAEVVGEAAALGEGITGLVGMHHAPTLGVQTEEAVVAERNAVDWARRLAESTTAEQRNPPELARLRQEYAARQVEIDRTYKRIMSGEAEPPPGVSRERLRRAVEGDPRTGERIPLSFPDAKTYHEFQADLRAALESAEIHDAVVQEVGSATKGYKSNPDKKFAPWSPASDADFAVFSRQALMQAHGVGAQVNRGVTLEGRHTVFKNKGEAGGMGFRNTRVGRNLQELSEKWTRRLWPDAREVMVDFKLNLGDDQFNGAITVIEMGGK
ncbi:MAG TPA: DUF4157 domain-containing protein [Kofleriaceae bacterium]|nr:DUF4157 domain-containing protein [Kofleriaceae bacterium]